MERPAWTTAEWLAPHVKGAAFGAVLTMAIGFWGIGWAIPSTAEKMAAQRAEGAVARLVAAQCVINFRAQPDAAAQLIAFNKVSEWERNAFLEKGGWGNISGVEKATYEALNLCATGIGAS
jgi:hypothetical protein